MLIMIMIGMVCNKNQNNNNNQNNNSTKSYHPIAMMTHQWGLYDSIRWVNRLE